MESILPYFTANFLRMENLTLLPIQLLCPCEGRFRRKDPSITSISYNRPLGLIYLRDPGQYSKVFVTRSHKNLMLQFSTVHINEFQFESIKLQLYLLFDSASPYCALPVKHIDSNPRENVIISILQCVELIPL